MQPAGVYLGGDISLTFEHSDRSNLVAPLSLTRIRSSHGKKPSTISVAEGINCCSGPTTVCYIPEASLDNAVLSNGAIAFEKRILASSVGTQLILSEEVPKCSKSLFLTAEHFFLLSTLVFHSAPVRHSNRFP